MASDDSPAPGDPAAARAKAQSLGKWISLWASKRRKITSLSILSPDGAPASSSAESAKLLYLHWKEVFSLKPVNLGTASITLGALVQPCPPGINWTPSFDSFFAWLCSKKDTGGCGPDGIPYSFWALAPLPYARAIYDHYLALCDGDPPQITSTIRRLFFLLRGRKMLTSPTNSRGLLAKRDP